MEPLFTEVRNFGLQGCSVIEKGAVSQRLLGIYKHLERSTLFDPGLHSYNYIKRKLDCIHFSDNFPKFSAQLFQITLMKLCVGEFSRVPGGRL